MMISGNANMQSTPYEKIGGEKSVQTLVDRFYDLMNDDESVEGIRKMHAKSLRISREKLYLFLSGWLGGPQLYVEKYGHPMLRKRHLPFAIGESERDQWLKCMNIALDEQVEEPLRAELKASFFKVADHMINQ
jgi:hemoglobin